jgi:hypothetical protein
MAATRTVVTVYCLPGEQRCVGRPRNLARLVQTAVCEFVKQEGRKRKEHLENGSGWQEGRGSITGTGRDYTHHILYVR